MAETIVEITHKIELNLLMEFKKMTKKLNIPYIALGGTLLGAIRHRGFIPWDDDMDVGLLRSDYEKLLAAAPGLLTNQPYFLQDQWSDENYALSYAKLLDRDTFIEEKNNVNFAKKGIFIDIFPIDKIPNSKAKQRAQMANIRRLDSRLYLKLRYNFIDNPIRKLYSELSIEQVESANDLKQQRDKIEMQYHESETAMNLKNLASQYDYDSEIYLPDHFVDTKEIPFETTTINIPVDFDNILRSIYGDYMILPPENQQNQKHISRLIVDNQEYFK